VAVELTSPVLGQNPGYSYTGPLEAWLLAEGYAKQASYTGPGVANTGAADTTVANDPTLASNREAPYFPLTEDRNVTIANDADNLNEPKFPAPVNFDFDAGGTDTEAPVFVGIEPDEGPEAGGTVVRIVGDNLEGVTGVTFDTVAGTSLDLSEVQNGFIEVTTPAGTAGPATVVVTDAVGSDTEVGVFTYVDVTP
jgi:hypothetical protein